MALQKYPPTVLDVVATLKNRYRDFNHYNLKNTLDELLFIICSTKTDETSYRSTFRSLKETFHTHLRIAEAPAGCRLWRWRSHFSDNAVAAVDTRTFVLYDAVAVLPACYKT